jgi:hypothetical protein
MQGPHFNSNEGRDVNNLSIINKSNIIPENLETSK